MDSPNHDRALALALSIFNSDLFNKHSFSNNKNSFSIFSNFVVKKYGISEVFAFFDMNLMDEINLYFGNKSIDFSDFEELENIDIIMNQVNNTKIDVKNNKLENINIEKHNCGLLNNECKYYAGLHFRDESNENKKFKNCCHFGKVTVDRREYPNILKELIKNKNFIKNIRSYNSVLSFAFMGETIEQFT